MSSLANCIFCKIVKGEIPCFKLLESDTALAFMDIGPIARGHCLVIPKCWCSCSRMLTSDHAAKLTDLPDDQMGDILPMAKKLAQASGAENYNILQNNGRIAHQEVDHVHFHMIPKPEASDKSGLVVGWPGMSHAMTNANRQFKVDDIAAAYEEVKKKL
ncbi:hydrolase [Trichosporon asahii var. asahii CBS 2479]|uniref:Hydrolase n=1 Tax=Trichosporon asahii var. asahii (strain ATCC 90039 / CBS 2479 / JCM 2466 / KCTC 7840 / NBRC 103889/ NCYC 2677 / UAMH 7654) TaxID=1186058 RepID=J5QNH2_TRIAS|nr:hydrolase [Trichosporon asahii var. asahii CBS 2479]EJT48278.1 hydrolase [Trichosporon asahii var. asahii CBS 2479]